MNSELSHLIEQLTQAQMPEEVFGTLRGRPYESLSQLRKVYHRLAKVAHPDLYQIDADRLLAQQAFGNLADWFSQAEEKIKAQTYGLPQTTILRTKKREYILDGRYTLEGIYTCYSGHYESAGRRSAVTLKITREPGNNDLAQNEAKIVRLLLNGHEAEKFASYIPKLIEAFALQENSLVRQANVFEKTSDWSSLEDVHRSYPRGVNPKDMAWMWRRLLVALGFAHINQVIHGAVLPKNIWLLPHDHGLRLDSWSAAINQSGNSHEPIAIIDRQYMAWYPTEVLNKETPLPGTDIALAAKCMIYLLGGDPQTKYFPTTVPLSIQRFLTGCALPNKRARPQDAWALKEEFDELIEKIWGERKFHPFKM